MHSYMQLFELMVKTAKSQKRIYPKKCKDANEKYVFRTWLVRLGMKGDEYKTARMILMNNLQGHAAFWTKEQYEAAKEKNKARYEEQKERACEQAFIRL